MTYEQNLIDRITYYLSSGGLFNPELADHLAVRNLLMECREALAQPEQTNTRPYYTIDELNAWADEKEKQAWRNAAIRIGEELSSVGPFGYYDMTAKQWLDWALSVVTVHAPPPQRKPLTDEQIHYAFRTNSVMVDNGNVYMVAGMRAVNITRAIEAAHGIGEKK